MSFNRHLTFFSSCLLLVVIMTLEQIQGQSLQPRARNSSISGQNSTSNIMVVNKSPPDGRIIKQGTKTSLTCASNINWFFGVWKSPGGSKKCAIQQESNPQNVCSGDQRITLKGRGNSCEVELRNVRPEDHGQWTCLLTDDAILGADKSTINIEVGVPAKVRFDPGYGDLGILRITEGETTKIRCAATGGYPAPQLSWSEPADSEIDLTAEPEIVTLTNDHTTNVYHTIQYRAALRDNNTVITCVATQLDHYGKDLYESSTAVVLQVDKIVLPPLENALTQKIGIISGVLLSVIFIILVIIFTMFIVCKRKNKRSRHASSQVTDETSSPGPNSSNIKPIWTTSRGMITSPVHSSKVYNEKEAESQNSSNLDQRQNSMVQSQNQKPFPASGPTPSRGTVLIQSNASLASWEEDRSVGGEIEDSPIHKMICQQPRIGTKTPSLHETHFDSEVDYPITVLHPPDSYISYHPGKGLQRLQNQSSIRPSSSIGESTLLGPHWSAQPHLNLQRSSSAQSGTNMCNTLGTRPSHGHTTSVKSVFDCDLGCFENKHGEHMHGEETVESNPNASLDTTLSGQTF